MYLPAAIHYGISYETFWNLNPRIMEIYQRAYNDKVRQEIEISDYNAWVHNQYTLMAIGSALNGKKCKYPKKPIGLKKNEDSREIEETEENYLIEMKSVIAKMNSGFI